MNQVEGGGLQVVVGNVVAAHLDAVRTQLLKEPHVQVGHDQVAGGPEPRRQPAGDAAGAAACLEAAPAWACPGPIEPADRDLTNWTLAMPRARGSNDQANVPSGVAAATMPFGEVTTASGPVGEAGSGCPVGSGDGEADGRVDAGGASCGGAGRDATWVGGEPHAAIASSSHPASREGVWSSLHTLDARLLQCGSRCG